MVIGSPKLQTVDLGSRDCLSGKRKRNETRRQVKGEHKAARGGEGVGRSTAARVPEGSRGRWARVRGVLTVDHGQPGLVQEANPAVLEKPDGEDGEREQQDEGEQAHAVLPVALLCLLLRGELLHGAAVLSRRPRGGGRGRPAQPPTQQQREQRHQQQPRWQRPGRPPRAEARRVTRLHGPSAARASCTLGPAARTVGSFPWRHRPARVAAATAAPPPARAGQGPGTRRESRWGRGARSAQDPQAPPPARVPVRPPAAPRPPPPQPGPASLPPSSEVAYRPLAPGPSRGPLSSLRSSLGPGVPGQAIWARGAAFWALAAALRTWDARGRPCLARASSWMCGLDSCVWDHLKCLIPGQCVAALGAVEVAVLEEPRNLEVTVPPYTSLPASLRVTSSILGFPESVRLHSNKPLL